MKSVVLLSGGLDSSVNFYQAVKIHGANNVMALTIDYAQRAGKKEIETANWLCEQLNTRHEVIELPWFSRICQTSLVNKSQDVPVGRDVSIDDMQTSHKTAKSVWVPNRNGILLNIAAGFAESVGAKEIVVGFNAEEAKTFPDNSPGFVLAIESAFQFSTANHVVVTCHTLQMNKKEIVGLGKTLHVPFEKLWPCYFGEKTRCEQCESCQRFQAAILGAG
jgi:7-cyano-7-deazaguanine synthase